MTQAAASINLRSSRVVWAGSGGLRVWTVTFRTRSQTDIMGDGHLFVMLSSGCVEQYGAISHSGDTGKWTREIEMELRVIYLSDAQKASPKEKYHVLIIGVRWHICFTDGAFKLCGQTLYTCRVSLEFGARADDVIVILSQKCQMDAWLVVC